MDLNPMSHEYFSDRERGHRPRIIEEIPPTVWDGIHGLIYQLQNNESFGHAFSHYCPDGPDNCGCDETLFNTRLRAEIPDIVLPLNETPPPDLVILDLIEFCYKYTSKPRRENFHENLGALHMISNIDYMLIHGKKPGHYHFLYNIEEGRSEFRNAINLIFSRNGIIYELTEDGRIIRLAQEGLQEQLQKTVFRTGDESLDNLLNVARIKFLNPHIDVRKEALEKLWDAWERLKTLEAGKKKTSIEILLKKVSPEPKFCDELNTEGHRLSDIGNNFMIRHSETDRTQITSGDHIEYLFSRMFALIYLILKSTNRIK